MPPPPPPSSAPPPRRGQPHRSAAVNAVRRKLASRTSEENEDKKVIPPPPKSSKPIKKTIEIEETNPRIEQESKQIEIVAETQIETEKESKDNDQIDIVENAETERKENDDDDDDDGSIESKSDKSIVVEEVKEKLPRKTSFRSKKSSKDEIKGELEQKFAAWQEKAVPRQLCSKDLVEELHKLVNTPVPEGEIIKCQIERVQVSDSVREIFSLSLPIVNKTNVQEKRLTIMLGQKRASSRFTRPHYVISLDQDDFETKCKYRSRWYFGKLSACSGNSSLIFNSTMQYLLFDAGMNPTKVLKAKQKKNDRNTSEDDESDTEEEDTTNEEKKDETKNDQGNDFFDEKRLGLPRKTMASIIYPSDASSTECMQMSAMLPMEPIAEELRENLEEDHKEAWVYSSDYNLTQPSTCPEEIREILERHILFTSIPGNRKRPKIGKHCRYPVAPSIKNYELAPCTKNTPTNFEVGLTAFDIPDATTGMARIGSKRFFMTVTHPLSIFQAFGIALSRFDATSSTGAKLTRHFKF